MDTVTHPTDGVVYGGRFQSLRPLKFGPGTATFLGRDLVSGAEVVIKTASPTSVAPDARLRLEHEAKVLGDLGCPSLTPVIAAGHSDGVVYSVTPWVSGVTLRERLDRGPLALAEILSVGRTVSGALQHAHERGVLHRDIKPSNVIVDSAVPLTRATLIDFGFARSEFLNPAIRDISVGTLAYLAPEQAGVLDRSLDERSDLYALGVLLFECVAGRVPFQADNVGDLLRHHLSTKPPELRSLGYDIPRALDEVIQRLLRKDPDDRYQTAEAVQADLAEICEGLTKGVRDPVVVVGLRDRRRTLAESAFLGRETELAALGRALERSRQGTGGLVLLEGESGGGKTRLLEEFVLRSGRSGAWVLRGQGVDQAALRPFQVLDGVVQGLLTRCSSDAEFVERVRNRLGDQLEAACEAVPQLSEVLEATTAHSVGQEEHGEFRSLRALSALLDALGTTDQPAVIILDDVQWADELTVKLIEYWQRRLERSEVGPSRRNVLIVAAFRSEEVNSDHVLRRVPAMASLTLAPFTAPVLRCLAESMAGTLPDEAIEVITRLADGSPFMATAVLQGLVEIGGLVPNDHARDGTRWAIDRDVMAEAQSSRRAAVFLARRLARLPTTTLDLLSVGAVLGKEFEPTAAGELASLSEHDVSTACDEARKRHLIWTSAGDFRCVFVHDKIREALLARLTDEERRVLHGAAAVKIEAENRDRVFDLAYHFDAAGQSERALPYALQAAEAARSRYALAVAERQYRIAESGIGTRDRATQRQVAEGLSDVLMLRGRYEEAEEQLLKAFSLADEPLVQAQVQGKLGELAFKRGDVRTASTALETALDLLDQPLARSPVRAFSLAIWEIAVQFLHAILPRRYVARRSFEAHGARRDLLVAKLYSRLAYAYWFARGAIPTLWAHLRELNLAERYPPSRELGQAYANHSAVMTMLPWFSRGIVYAKKGLAIREGIGDLWGVGQSLHFYGLLLLAAARNKDALDILRESTRRFERTGDLWELNNALFNVAFCLYRLGDLHGAVELGRRVIQSGRDIGNIRDLAIGLEIWAKASGGKTAREAITHELERESDDVHTVVTVMQAEAVCLLAENRPGEACTILLDAQQRVKSIGLRNEYVAPIPVWLVTALRTDVAQRSPYDRAGLLLGRYGRLSRAVRRALRVGRRYRNSLPHALREAGLVAAMRGRLRKARKYLNQSLALAEQQGARFEYAQTLLVRGRVGLEVKWPGAASDVEEATKSLRALGAYWVLGEKGPDEASETVTPGLIDRFDTVLDVGRRIASSLSRETVYHAIRDAALTLLRGEACLVLDVVGRSVADERRFQVVSGGKGVGQSGDPGYSRTLVDRAIETGRPVVGDGAGHNATESVVLSGARSILCAPIAVRGGIVACFYVTHHQVGGLFGPEEERLAEFIATLAGAALENVEGLTKAESELIASSAAGLAHAIKNPVAVIRAYVQLLRTADDRRDPAVIGRYLQTMNGALDRITELTDRLKRVPTQGCQKAPVALDRLMDRTVTEIRSLFSEARGYKVDMEIDPRTSSSIMADRDQLDLVLTNLLANACEAMPQGGLVQLSARPADGQSIAIVISDQGGGVPASIQPRLFQPFVTTKPQGTGLGLWVCRTIVEQHHGGHIAVTSEPGSGTTVVVTLPIGDVHR